MNQPGVPLVERRRFAATAAAAAADRDERALLHRSGHGEGGARHAAVGRCRSASRRRRRDAGAVRSSAVRRRPFPLDGAGVSRVGVRERRRARLFPHRVLAGRCFARSRRHRDTSHRAGAAVARRRRMGARPRRPAHGRRLPDARRRVSAVSARTASSRKSRPRLAVRPRLPDDRRDAARRFERFVQSLFGPLYRELGLAAAPGDDDDKRGTASRPSFTTLGAGRQRRGSRDRQRAQRSNVALGRTAARRDGRQGDRPRRGPSRRRGAVGRLLNASQKATSPAERYRYLYALGGVRGSGAHRPRPELRADAGPAQPGHGDVSRRLSRQPRRARRARGRSSSSTGPSSAPKITISLGDVRLVESLGAFCDARSRDDIKDFFAAHKLPAASRALDQTIERSTTASR